MAVSRVELQKLIDDFEAIPPDLRRELPGAIKKAAKPMLGQMKANSAWSTRIPSTVRVSTSFGAAMPGIRIVAGGTRAPHAVLYEGLHGNPFRAPLFGDREHWYPHSARPFFYKAVDEKGAAVTEQVGEAVTDVVRRHGF